MPPVHGLIPVLATPFSPAGEIDHRSLRRLVAFQAQSGADAVAVFGLASEAFALTHDERRQILSTVIDEAPQLPIVAGLGATGIRPALDELRHLTDGGARTVMALPPFMVKPSPSQVLDFYGTLAAEASRHGAAVMVQDAPGATGVTMSIDLIAHLSALDGVASVKIEAPPTVPKMAAVKAITDGSGLVLLGGQNAQFVLDEYASGASGTMPACEFTDILSPILEQWESGDHAEAREAFASLLPLVVWGLQSGYAWAIHKEVLVIRGIIESSAVRSPAIDLPGHMRELLVEILRPLPVVVPS